MGFLDRLVGDLLARQTGLPVRRLVRRAGVGRLVTLGGLAAGAVVAVDWAQRQQSAPASTPAPPLPPLPGSRSTPVALPPLPPRSEVAAPPAVAGVSSAPPPTPQGDSNDDLPPTLRYAVLRTIVAAALADGDLTAAERAVLERNLAGAGLDPNQMARLRSDLSLPATPKELAGLVASSGEAEILYRFATLIVAADGMEQPAERGWLDQLGDALSIAREERRSVEEDLLGGLADREAAVQPSDDPSRS